MRKFPPEVRAQILSGRFTWSDADKVELIKEAEEHGYAQTARLYNIARTQLAHWRKDLSERELLPLVPLRRGRPLKARMGKQ